MTELGWIQAHLKAEYDRGRRVVSRSELRALAKARSAANPDEPLLRKGSTKEFLRSGRSPKASHKYSKGSRSSAAMSKALGRMERGGLVQRRGEESVVLLDTWSEWVPRGDE